MSAKELRAWRAERNWTQEKAALWIGYSTRHYQRFEEGDATIPVKVVRAVELARVSAAK